jgi:hypothetical protein
VTKVAYEVSISKMEVVERDGENESSDDDNSPNT